MRKRLLAVLVLVLATLSCATPKFQAEVATQLNQVGDELQAQRQDLAILQEQIDSLKTVAAKQDSLIRKLANLAGVPAGGDAASGMGNRESGIDK